MINKISRIAKIIIKNFIDCRMKTIKEKKTVNITNYYLLARVYRLVTSRLNWFNTGQ